MHCLKTGKAARLTLVEHQLPPTLSLNEEFVEIDVFDDARFERLVQSDGNMILQEELALNCFDIIEGLAIEYAHDFIARSRRIADDFLKALFIEHLECHFDTHHPPWRSGEIHSE